MLPMLEIIAFFAEDPKIAWFRALGIFWNIRQGYSAGFQYSLASFWGHERNE